MKKIYFDMDGTIADFYGVEGWLNYLNEGNPFPYATAKPLVNMQRLARRLNLLKKMGYEVCILSWLSKTSTPEFDELVIKAKREWLENMGFPYDHFHGVKYGTTKASCVSRYLEESETAILIDDNAKVRNGWSLGDTIDPTTENIIEMLKALL